MKDKTHYIGVKVTSNMKQGLKAEAVRQFTNVSTIIRRAIAEYLEKDKQ